MEQTTLYAIGSAHAPVEPSVQCFVPVRADRRSPAYAMEHGLARTRRRSAQPLVPFPAILHLRVSRGNTPRYPSVVGSIPISRSIFSTTKCTSGLRCAAKYCTSISQRGFQRLDSSFLPSKQALEYDRHGASLSSVVVQASGTALLSASHLPQVNAGSDLKCFP